jgi:hypothetical protein
MALLIAVDEKHVCNVAFIIVTSNFIISNVTILRIVIISNVF